MRYVCVLKAGGEYAPYHAVRLQRYLGAPLTCLTDYRIDNKNIEVIPLVEQWPGWWSKIELFRPGLFNEPVVYLDLDVAVLGDVSRLHADTFTMCRDFIKPQMVNSSVMSGPLPPEVFDTFYADPDKYMARYRSWPRIGDQAFIEDTVSVIDRFDPGLVVSYRQHCKDSVPEGAVVVAFHGKPKPWQIAEEWAQ